MSMPTIEKSDNPIDRNQSVSNLIESVALMETGLSHIINAEGEKIQKVIRSDDPSAEVPIEDIINVNTSVERMVNTVSKLEMILQNKLDISKDLDQETPDPIIESTGAIIAYSGYVETATLIDGTPDSAALLGFQNDSSTITIDFDGNTDVLNPELSVVSYPIPRNGTLTAFSTFFEITASPIGPTIEKQIIAKVFVAEPNSTTYNAINESTIYLTPPIPADTQEDFRINGSVSNLNVALEANTKILIVFYCEAESGITSVRGLAGAAINIV